MNSLKFICIGFLLFSCSSKQLTQSESTVPVSATIVESQQTSLIESECQNVKNIIGFADISFNEKTVLQFYTKPKTGMIAQTLRFYDDKDLKMFSFRAEGKKSYSLLHPDAHKLDYFDFDLAVKSQADNWLEVIVDEKNNETLWLQESSSVQFKNWEQYFKNPFSIERLNPQTNPLFSNPKINSKKIEFNGDDCFKVEEMQGDWIKVTEQNNCDNKPVRTVSGWIRWRDENGCILVNVFPFA